MVFLSLFVSVGQGQGLLLVLSVSFFSVLQEHADTRCQGERGPCEWIL